MSRSVMVVAALLAACSGDPAPGRPGGSDPEATSTTVVGAIDAELKVEVVDEARLPLARRLIIDAPAPIRAVVTIRGETVDTEVFATHHEVPLVGFPPETTTAVQLHLLDEAGAEADAAFEITTGALPAGFPRSEVLVHEVGATQPGYTLLVALEGDSNEGWALIYDGDGQLVWAWDPAVEILDATFGDDGNLLVLAEEDGATGGPLLEVDLLGQEVARYQGSGSPGPGVPVDVVGFHHEARRTDAGTILSITKEPIQALYPTNYDDPADVEDATLSGDRVVEFDATGAILRAWRVADHLDPRRIGYDSLSVNAIDGNLDWTHGNAALYDPLDGNLVVSLRNQDTLLKLTPDGELVWILANPDNWSSELEPYLLDPVGDLTWFYHQHGPAASGDGRYLIFDNGDVRASPFTDQVPLPVADRWSRVVEVRVDAAAGTVEQTWELVDTSTGVLYSAFVGDADYLDNGHVLSCWGFVSTVDGVPLSETGAGAFAVRVMEHAPGDPHQIVFDMRIWSTAAEQPTGWMAYRADRFPSLYPRAAAR